MSSSKDTTTTTDAVEMITSGFPKPNFRERTLSMEEGGPGGFYKFLKKIL